MEYVTEQKETVFEPDFGYGYLPEEDRPVRPEKKKREVPRDNGAAGDDLSGQRTLLAKPPAMPFATLAAALLIALLLLICALFASSGTAGQASARANAPFGVGPVYAQET